MNDMKLALALSERADLQKRIADIGLRLNRNATVQEGEGAVVPVELAVHVRGRVRLVEVDALRQDHR